MPEAQAVSRVKTPNTKDSLKREFAQLGVMPGMTLLVHSSLSNLGWVCGGPVAVIEALLESVTESGTVIMPTHSCGNTEPSYWQNPPVPESWWPLIREAMPAFDPCKTPTAFMGAVPEAFRSFPGVVRSRHPAVSFAAWGKEAEFVTQDHNLDFSLGEGSPLARVYDLDGFVLLLGVSHDSNTSLHLAEVRSNSLAEKAEGGALDLDGQKRWVPYRDYCYDSDDFETIGTEFESLNQVSRGPVGASTSTLFSQRLLVDFGTAWMKTKRERKFESSCLA